MWYVYVLQNQRKHWYIGLTGDLRKRILKHNSGKNKSTKYGIPWKLIYYEACLIKEDARARERYLTVRNWKFLNGVNQDWVEDT